MAQSKAYDSNAGQWPMFSGFNALNPNSAEIRVLRLADGPDKDALHYLMHHTDVRSPRRSTFSALSYSWGAPVPNASQKEILINGESVRIRPTLHSFLVTLAGYDPTVDLWIDAVCINQSDVEERNQQISMMADIFGSAENVYVWLGRGDDDTSYALEHITNANPATPFDGQQFQTCTERLFTAAYWTRRWVLQEFALAQQVIIVCGSHVVTWHDLLQKVNGNVLSGNDGVLKIFENFNNLKVSASQRSYNLLDLMLRYDDARCIDRRDKAFALRGIARDGARLSPDYKETVADVFFRVLSQLSTVNVLPEMIGYRWPHRSARDLQGCLLMSRVEVLGSLQDKPSDVLLAVFDHVGTVASVAESTIQYKQVTLNNVGSQPLYGSKDVLPGDIIYSLRSSARTPRTALVAFRPSSGELAATGLILRSSPSADTKPVWEWRNKIVLDGVEKCSRNRTAKSSRPRILCHISRLAMIWLWLFDTGKEQHLYGHDTVVALPRKHRLCRCEKFDATAPGPLPDVLSDPENSLELLPSGLGNSAQWDTTRGLPWQANEVDDGKPMRHLDFEHGRESPTGKQSTQFESSDQGRTHLSYAAEEGLIFWIKRLLSMDPRNVDHPDHVIPADSSISGENDMSEYLHRAFDRPDVSGRTPLSYAVKGGHDEAVKLLLESGFFDHNHLDRQGYSPLQWAISTGYTQGIELLITVGNVDPGYRHRQAGRSPLSWAAQTPYPTVVQTLLASNKVNPDEEDADGATPLVWAAKLNHLATVELLLATGKVNCNARDTEGRTPLSWAAQHGNVRMTELLLACPTIEPDIMRGDRLTPLRIAAQYGNVEVFKRILDTGKVKYGFEYAEYDRLYGSGG